MKIELGKRYRRRDGYGYGGKRGYVAHTFTSHQKAIEYNRNATDTEIVELTGTLSARKV